MMDICSSFKARPKYLKKEVTEAVACQFNLMEMLVFADYDDLHGDY